MRSLEDDIKSSEFIINKSHLYGSNFTKYSQGYFFTTEQIRAYLTNEEFNKNNALTVLGSGDQTLNLIRLGVANIDTFDINELTFYIYSLKKAIILSLSYQDFISYNKDEFCVNSASDFIKLLEKIRSNMLPEVYTYFSHLMYLRRIIINNDGIRKLLNLGIMDYDRNFNLYADSSYDYNLLKDRINKVNVTHYFGDARKIPDKLDKNYDLILLSNISDYLGDCKNKLTIEEFRRYIKSYYELLNDGGLIINYLYFNALEFDKYPIIMDSTIYEKDIGRRNIKVLNNEEGYLRIRKK